MTTLTRTSVLIACLLAALLFYMIGFPAGSVVFIGIGLLFELLFWLGLFTKVSHSNEASKH